MIAGIVDTNILIELYRSHPLTKTWLAGQADLAITALTWLEFMEGARGKAGQARCLQIMAPFQMLFFTDSDQQWTMTQLLNYRLSHGISFKDRLIAACANRLQIPLYTQNIKDFLTVLPVHLVIKPY